jgi:hypothetical protein
MGAAQGRNPRRVRGRSSGALLRLATADPLRSASTGCEDQRAVRGNGNGVLRVGTA